LTATGWHSSEAELRDEIVRVCHLMWQKGLVAASDGNVSARLGDNRLLATPSGVSKGFLAAADLVLLDLDGTPLVQAQDGTSRAKPSSEILLHLEVYRQRPDVRAVVHAHPPLALAFTIAGIRLPECMLPEVVINLGEIPTTAYATPSSAEGPRAIRELICGHDALILDRHGSVTVGCTPFEAYMKLEKVEHLAKVALVARQLGRVSELPQEEVAKLIAMRRTALGLSPEYNGEACVHCGACGKAAETHSSEGEGIVSDELRRTIVESVVQELARRAS